MTVFARRGISGNRKVAQPTANDSDNKLEKGQNTTFSRNSWKSNVLLLLLLICILIWESHQFFLGKMRAEGTETESLTYTSAQTNVKANITSTSNYPAAILHNNKHEQHENCSISFRPPYPPRNAQNWRKPLWVVSYPSSGSANPSKKGDLSKELIDALTGLKQATKNYHMSVRGGKLKRCKGISETAACTQGHPYVPVGPESQTENFQSGVIYVIRNFATAFPAGLTDKYIAYHNGKGQIPETNWRSTRDEYFESSLESWFTMLRWWRGADYYKIALYLSIEELFSPITGPDTVHKLSQVYSDAGFEVASTEDDILCIWFQTIEKEKKRQNSIFQYTPGYTSKQRNLMLQKLDMFIATECEDDAVLRKLLTRYRMDIASNTRLDD